MRPSAGSAAAREDRACHPVEDAGEPLRPRQEPHAAPGGVGVGASACDRPLLARVQPARRKYDLLDRSRIRDDRPEAGIVEGAAVERDPADADLEDFWADRDRILPWLRTAAFDLVVAPSYSKYVPRPRTDFLFAAKRSLAAFAALQAAGIPAIPRLMWELDHDVSRAAAWVRANPVVSMVGVDLQTYKSPVGWRDQLEGLARLDQLTGRRLRFVINGPTTAERFADVFQAVSSRRVCLTNMTFASVVREADEQLTLFDSADPESRRLAAKCLEMRRRIFGGPPARHRPA